MRTRLIDSKHTSVDYREDSKTHYRLELKKQGRILKKDSKGRLTLELNSSEKEQFIQNLYDYTLSVNPRKGLLPDEVCLLVKETGCPILDEISELNTVPQHDKQDFIVTPILKDNHFISAVVHFLNNESEPSLDREIYIFDSHQQDKIPFLTQQDGINKCLLLNTENLQGNSDSCGYFTIEFIKEAYKSKNFEELHTKCQNHEMQKIVYQNVKKLFKQHNKNLDELIGKYHSKILDEDGFGTANRQHKNQQSLNDIIKRIKSRQQKAEESFVERYKKAREKRNTEKKNSIYYYGK